MKQTLIKITDDHYVIVDDSEIKKGDWFICSNEIHKCTGTYSLKVTSYVECKKGPCSIEVCKKITHSTLPLEDVMGLTNKLDAKGWVLIKPIYVHEVKELIGEIDKFVLFLDREVELGLSPKDIIERIKWYYQKYFKEDKKEKKYTEEDMINWTMCMISQYVQGNTNIWNKDLLRKSLPTPKTQWEVTFDEQGKLKLV